MFYLKTASYGNAHQELAWCSVHGINVRKVYHCSLIAQVFKWRISKVKVNAFHQHVGGNKHTSVVSRVGAVLQHGTVIAHAKQSRLILHFHVGCEMVYQTKLAESGYFGHILLQNRVSKIKS